MSEVTDTLLKQRLRNRIIESLEAFADKNVVGTLGTDEVVNIWYDSVDSERLGFYDEPIFSTEEIKEIHKFHNLIERSHRMVPSTWKADVISGSKEWSELAEAAREGLVVFNKRDRFDEDNEIT